MYTILAYLICIQLYACTMMDSITAFKHWVASEGVDVITCTSSMWRYSRSEFRVCRRRASKVQREYLLGLDEISKLGLRGQDLGCRVRVERDCNTQTHTLPPLRPPSPPSTQHTHAHTHPLSIRVFQSATTNWEIPHPQPPTFAAYPRHPPIAEEFEKNRDCPNSVC